MTPEDHVLPVRTALVIALRPDVHHGAFPRSLARISPIRGNYHIPTTRVFATGIRGIDLT